MDSDEDEDAESKAERLKSLITARTGNGATALEAAAQPSTADLQGEAGGKRGKKRKEAAKGGPRIEPGAELPEDVMDGWHFRTASTEGRMVVQAVQALQAVKGTGGKAKGNDAKANAVPPVSFGPASASKASSTRQTSSAAEATAGGEDPLFNKDSFPAVIVVFLAIIIASSCYGRVFARPRGYMAHCKCYRPFGRKTLCSWWKGAPRAWTVVLEKMRRNCVPP